MPGMNCIVVTPEATVLDEKADFVAMPLFDGEIGILPGHSPMIGRLGYGELRIRVGSNVSRYYVDGGFVQVTDNVITVLTNRSVPAGELDKAAAEEQLQHAQSQPVYTAELLEIRDRLEAQARGQMRIAAK